MNDISIKTGEKNEFGTLDYVLFSLMFCASAGIGFFHAYKDRNKKNARDFHLGGRKMHAIPVSLSLASTFMSALTLLGTPAEIYTHNTMFYWILVAMLIATASAAHIFIPIFYRLNKTSCFEYIELRFGIVARLLASFLFLVQTLVYLSFVLYAPSLAFEAVTGVSLWGTMIGVAAVCTLYTTLGGMKTVLWTDSLQLTIRFAGLIAVLIEGSKANDGFGNAWKIAKANHRIKSDDWSFDPKTRHSIWTVAIGGSFFWTYLYGVNQAQVQRANSLKSLKRAQIALWLNFPSLVIIITLTCMTGIVMYALYSGCHPIEYGLVDRNDQLLPLFVLDVLGNIPGLPGVFVACIFSGSLSTISSGLNAMSAVLLEDFIKPSPLGRNLVGKRAIMLSKVLVLLIGGLQFGIAVAISEFSGLILQFSYSVYSVLAGPLMGLFVSGMFLPWSNQIGSVFGLILSLVCMCWLAVGALIEKPSSLNPPSPTSTLGCNYNISGFSTKTTITTLGPVTSPAGPTTTTEEPLLYDFYRMSYLWYTGLGMIVNVFITLCVSLITGYTRPSTLDGKLMCPIFDILFPFLPESIRKPLRFGVVYEKEAKYITSDKSGDIASEDIKTELAYDID